MIVTMLIGVQTQVWQLGVALSIVVMGLTIAALVLQFLPAVEQVRALVLLYRESGSSWWPILWGPAFALAGYLIELITGPASVALWTIVGLGLTLCARSCGCTAG